MTFLMADNRRSICHLLKKIQKIPVTFSFHLCIRNKAKRRTVDAVPHSVWRFWIIGENMSEMRVAASAAHFSTLHPMTPIFFCHYYRVFDRL